MKTLVTTILAVLAVCSDRTWADAQGAAEQEFFESRIRPVLVQQCYRCHSQESGKSKGGLLLDSQAGWQSGGDSGAAIVPGKPDESLLFAAISRNGETSEMPPTSHLSPSVIRDFRKWIKDGAVDPRVGQTGIRPRKAMDIAAGRKFWSFQPRRRLSPKQSIDSFVGPQAPAAPADKLVRRLYLDLIGLPPTADERTEFLRVYQNESPKDAVATFADRLLARNEFGEKWARHWLDVARYADSNGGDFNLTFHESWRYRNYVIDAFNSDLPYDQFLCEQIAGDQMQADTVEQQNRQLIATGFLMVSPKMLTERDKVKMHLDIADEQVDTIGRAIMGLTIGCARCHDHKFDPIPTTDYYAMTGILHSTRVADRVLMNNVNVTGWTNTNLAVDKKTRASIELHQTKISQLKRDIAILKKVVPSGPDGVVVDDTEAEKTGPWRKSTLRPNHIGKHYLANNKDDGPSSITWKATLPKPGKYELRVSFGGGSGLAKRAKYLVRHAEGETELVINQSVKPNINGLWFSIGQFAFGTPESSKEAGTTTAIVQLTDSDAGGYVIADAIQLVLVDDLTKAADATKTSPLVKLTELQERLKKLEASVPKIPQAMAAQDATNERLGDLNIRVRGESKNLGPKVPRGFLQAATFDGWRKATISESESGRLQLAEWITHPNHPLTARVMANRIWQQLFGRGIVPTSDNFGTRGIAPTNPELLDYLAEKFIANDWSMKSLIQEIVRSETYQQTAMTASADDPDNALLRHQNRRPLPAESIRDSILAISKQLDRSRRKSVVSELGMYAIQTNGKRDHSLAETDKLRIRSIYMPIVRGAVPPSLAIFDLPNPDLVTGQRSVTTVPAQALFMMNSPFVHELARATSDWVAKENLELDDAISKMFGRILIRNAEPDDIAMGKQYITELMSEGKSRPDAFTSLAQVLFCSAEFRFVE